MRRYSAGATEEAEVEEEVSFDEINSYGKSAEVFKDLCLEDPSEPRAYLTMSSECLNELLQLVLKKISK